MSDPIKIPEERWKNISWRLPKPPGNNNVVYEQAQIAVLMDIRDELKILNHLLNCRNFTDIPFKLDAIVQHTKRPTKKPKCSNPATS